MGIERDRLTELHEDLRSTAEDLAADAARVRQIETEKAGLHPTDPKVAKLAEESEELTAQMADKAKIQSALIEEAQSPS